MNSTAPPDELLLSSLIISYYFPPIVAVGCNRSEGFVRHLPEFGWEPVVLTVEETQDTWVRTGGKIPAGARIERCRERNIVRWLDRLHAVHLRLAKWCGVGEIGKNYFREWFADPDPHWTWQIGEREVELARECDVIYVSCSPFTAATKAVWLKERTGKPLVVDFRDPWSLNPHIRRGVRSTRRNRDAERRVLESCDRLILNSPGAERLYRAAYPELASKMVCIPNGFDELRPPVTTRSISPFTILHLGTVYGTRNPTTLLDALLELDNPEIEFVHVGGKLDGLEKYEGRVKIKQLGVVPREKALELMETASLLLVLQGWEEGVKDYVAVAAKSYEYIATGLPILVYAPEGDNTQVIREYAAKSYLVTEPSVEKMKAAIELAYQERAQIKPSVKPEFIERFSRRNLTGRLANLFNTLAIKK